MRVLAGVALCASGAVALNAKTAFMQQTSAPDAAMAKALTNGEAGGNRAFNCGPSDAATILVTMDTLENLKNLNWKVEEERDLHMRVRFASSLLHLSLVLLVLLRLRCNDNVSCMQLQIHKSQSGIHPRSGRRRVVPRVLVLREVRGAHPEGNLPGYQRQHDLQGCFLSEFRQLQLTES